MYLIFSAHIFDQTVEGESGIIHILIFLINMIKFYEKTNFCSDFLLNLIQSEVRKGILKNGVASSGAI